MTLKNKGNVRTFLDIRPKLILPAVPANSNSQENSVNGTNLTGWMASTNSQALALDTDKLPPILLLKQDGNQPENKTKPKRRQSKQADPNQPIEKTIPHQHHQHHQQQQQPVLNPYICFYCGFQCANHLMRHKCNGTANAMLRRRKAAMDTKPNTKPTMKVAKPKPKGRTSVEMENEAAEVLIGMMMCGDDLDSADS